MMEPRLLLAYAMIATLAACLFGVWFWYSRDWRGHRRASRQGEASRLRRRAERLRDEGAG